MIDKRRIATYPQIGSYGLALKYLCQEGLSIDYKIPPKMTDKTLEIGAKYSPEAMCAPFKYMLGSYIEAIEAGANILIGLGGFCRLDFFPELHENIIKSLGYDIKFINFAQIKTTNLKGFYDKFKEINPKLSKIKFAKALPTFVAFIKYIDEIEDFIRKNRAFEVKKGDFNNLYRSYLKNLSDIKNKEELEKVHAKFMDEFKKIKLNKPQDRIKVAIIGEYYTIMEPFANYYIEDYLIERSVEVDRWMNFTNSLIYRPIENMQENIKSYSKYDMGATNIFTIERALKAARENFDGIVHVRSMGCTPEIDGQAVLDNIARDFDIPILYLTYDTNTTDLGIKTRMEAFYDMIIMKRGLN
jgi:predicted nucleotide-binding protein (sugar kinase/HSP70/actin superfamily)